MGLKQGLRTINPIGRPGGESPKLRYSEPTDVDGALGSVRQTPQFDCHWQAAISAEHYPLLLSDEIPLENLKGFLRCSLRGQLTGFECYHDDANEFMRTHSDINFGHAWQDALGLRWLGGKKDELHAAWIAATAYAQATGA